MTMVTGANSTKVESSKVKVMATVIRLNMTTIEVESERHVDAHECFG